MIRRYEPMDMDAALARLAGQVDGLQHDVSRLETLRADVDAHSRSLQDLAELLRRLRADVGAPEPLDETVATAAPPDWLTLTDPELAVEWLSDLDQWTRDIWLHFHPLQACWPWHPGVVAELLCCQHVWSDATDGGASALAAWHDRWRPGVASRITPALAGCERTDGTHLAAGGQRWTFDVTVLDEVAEWWARTHGSSLAPGLTPEARR